MRDEFWILFQAIFLISLLGAAFIGFAVILLFIFQFDINFVPYMEHPHPMDDPRHMLHKILKSCLNST